MLRWQRSAVPAKAAVRSSGKCRGQLPYKKKPPGYESWEVSCCLSHLLLRLVSFDIKELTNIDDHPTPALHRREMTIPFFDPVLGENELTALGLEGFGVDLE